MVESLASCELKKGERSLILPTTEATPPELLSMSCSGTCDGGGQPHHHKEDDDATPCGALYQRELQAARHPDHNHGAATAGLPANAGRTQPQPRRHWEHPAMRAMCNPNHDDSSGDGVGGAPPTQAACTSKRDESRRKCMWPQ